ncbi:iron chelate uptake ABC transporter family permease subunit [Marinomonas sp. M1K-6]|uniref:Iron chelate uptake ABC transporter family permease subunit n=1 Tax=Marinomonas profundi TaxID=2726122 RepID=A0A847QW44_9GAMM|nr:iron chelate uptake ABC transporter family permease subunit [Marinomonas profundi]NLQ17458.1 iron chelate uptake ABC transporter family permease subunit [Marinomonas profundi]UDV01981.1 iron chelate uptake ABC transporter family permease subunit [Marinomonas profundi]
MITVRLSFIRQCVALLLLLLICSWVSLFSWSVIPITPTDAIQALYNMNEESIAQHIVHDLRLPRVLIGLMVGANLAAAGVIMQGLTQNPLASPSVLGINAGAALGMATVSSLAPWFGLLGTSVAAMIGGGIAWALVMLLGNAWRGGNEHGRLVLAGVAISALCAALTKAVIIIAEDQAAGVLTWLAGSLTDARWQTFDAFWPVCILGLVGAMLIAPTLNLLQLGDDNARNLGVSLIWVKLGGSFLVLLLVGSAISSVGAIGFVGLLVPHMARMLVGQDHRQFLPIAMMLGAGLVVLSDTVSRAIIYPAETPAGAILALIGAPFFIYLVRKRTL